MKSGLSTAAVKRISSVLNQIVVGFPQQAFERDALNGLETLELKQRVNYIIAVLADYLPTDFEQAAEILLQIETHWDWGEEADPLRGFAAWPLTDYVAVYGLQHPELTLQVLKNLTSLFSAEFAIRPFIEQHFELTHQMLLIWCTDSNEHVRRLASEGCRPRLPWGKRLTKFCSDPSPILPILELLKDDSSLYVRRSVANNLNDISKDNPELVIQLCQRWMTDAAPETQWIIRHGLRSLVKQGRPEVFPLLGYSEQVQVNLKKLKIDRSKINLGEGLTVSIELESNSKVEQRLVVDYKIHHQKASGQNTAKVFKWKNITIEENESLSLTKVHPFKRITTRKYYAGQHGLELLINGQSMGMITFELLI